MSHGALRKSGAVAALLVAISLPAVAQAETAPSNDEITGAIEVTPLPGSVRQDPRGATAAPTDPMDCQQSPDPTLWYSVTAPAIGVMTLKSRGSIDFDGPANFDTNMAIYRGSPADLRFASCGTWVPDPDRGFWEETDVEVSAGERLYVMVAIPPLSEGITDPDGSPYSGPMTHSLTVSIRRPNVSVAVAISGGTASKSGVATITGTARCSFPVPASVSVSLTQEHRLLTATGVGGTSIPCDEDGETWRVSVTGNFGSKFVPGKATATADAFTADAFARDEEHATTTAALRLRSAR